MGMGCTQAGERVSAALSANGLLQHAGELFHLPKGFYSVVHVFLLLGYMAPARIRTIEQLRQRLSQQ
jgi:hypothetical protein